MKREGKIPRTRLYAKDLPPAKSLRAIAGDSPSESWQEITWREGTKGPLRSRFARLKVWLANGLVQGKTMSVEREELLVEWPQKSDSSIKFSISSLDPATPWRDMVRKAKGRFRVEQDYREMKRELGLDHFEGRSWQGWHHHVTLVAMAYAFLMLERIGNKKTSGLTLPTVHRWLQKALLMYTGICPTCGKSSPAETAQAVRSQMGFLGRFVNHRDITFLEVGPGDCALSLEVARFAKQVYAVDVSSEIVKGFICPPNFRLVISDGSRVPVSPGSVNVAYSNQLMEHLHPDDAWEQLNNIYRALVPGGIYVCMTSNRLNGPHDV